MNKAKAIKIVQKDIKFLVEDWFDRINDSYAHEHGGWDNVDDGDLAAAMRSLGEDEHAKAVRDAAVKFLQTPAGLKLIKENQSPFFSSLGDAEDE